MNSNKRNSEYILKQLFKDNFPLLVSVSKNIVKDSMVAEDIVLEVFHDFFKRYKELKKSNYKSYLIVAVKNKSLTYIRLNKKLIYIEDASFEINESENIDDLVATKQIHNNLYNEINKLPKKCREIFFLNTIGGYTMQEIAEELSISINTVKAQKTIAFNILRNRADKILLIFGIKKVKNN